MSVLLFFRFLFTLKGTLTFPSHPQLLIISRNQDAYYKKKHQTNPYKGSVDQDVVIIDDKGNAIPVPKGYRAAGTTDGKWIQVKDPKGNPEGTRKDGGGHRSHKDPRAKGPHGHRPGITNPDGTPWIPIY